MTQTTGPTSDAMLTWPGQMKCRFCRTPLTRLQSGIGRCDSEICIARHRNESHRLRYRLRWDEHVEAQHAGARAHGAEIAAGARSLGVSVDDLVVGIVPRIDRPLARPPAFQRAALLDHLRSITAAAFERADPGPFPVQRTRNEVPEPAVGTAACISCQGHCCVLGMAANAFLRVETIDHVRRHHPELGPDEIVAHYSEQIPEESVQDSCLFQGPRGCTLDRTWRADTCNNFQCNGKRQALERADGADRMLWIATQDGEGMAMVHDGHETRAVVPDAKAGDLDEACMARAVAAVHKRLPTKLRETAPTQGTVCRRCGAPISPEQAATTGRCGSSACDLAGRHAGA